MLCAALLGGGLLAAIPVPAAPSGGGAEWELRWTHSVEHTGWWERWRIEGDRLALIEARVKGGGAGMEPGEGSRLERDADGGEWWVWNPATPPLPEITLAASSFTADHRLCVAGHCRTLSAWLGGIHDRPVVLSPCDG